MHKLKMIKKYDSLINNKRQELDRLTELMTKVTVLDYTKERVQVTPNNDSLCDIISKISEIQEEIRKDLVEYVELREDCMRQIDALDNSDLIDIAYKYYFEFKSFEKVAEEIGISTRWVIELNKKLLESVH